MDFKVVTVLGLPTAVICLAASTAPQARTPASTELTAEQTAKALLEGDLHVLPGAAVAIDTTPPAFNWQQITTAWNNTCGSIKARGLAIQASLQLLPTATEQLAPVRLIGDEPFEFSDLPGALSDVWGGAFFANLRARCSAGSGAIESGEFAQPISEQLFVYSSSNGPASLLCAAGGMLTANDAESIRVAPR